MEEIAVGITSVVTVFDDLIAEFSNIFELLLLLGVLALSFWAKDVFFYAAAALITCFIAFSWTSDYPDIAMPIYFLGLYQLFTAVRMALGSGGSAKGMRWFKTMASKIKGWF